MMYTRCSAIVQNVHQYTTFLNTYMIREGRGGCFLWIWHIAKCLAISCACSKQRDLGGQGSRIVLTVNTSNHVSPLIKCVPRDHYQKENYSLNTTSLPLSQRHDGTANSAEHSLAKEQLLVLQVQHTCSAGRWRRVRFLRAWFLFCQTRRKWKQIARRDDQCNLQI
jgi:hypothetical protein